MHPAVRTPHNDSPRLVEGDALDVLPEVLADIPARFDVCVFSTLVLYQFEQAEINRLRALLAEHSTGCTVHWLSNDPTGERTPPVYRHVAFGAESRSRRLAEYKAHGEWIRWLAGWNRAFRYCHNLVEFSTGRSLISEDVNECVEVFTTVVCAWVSASDQDGRKTNGFCSFHIRAVAITDHPRSRSISEV